MSQTLELKIEKLSFGGDGIARHDGLVYFVPRSAPGDLLKVRIVEKKKNFARAEIIEILSPGPSRIQAPCSHFGKCGGCTWQHISYEEQLRQKQMIIEEQLSKVLKGNVSVLPILPSPEPFRYRNRIQLKFDGQKMGFYARQSHDIVDIEDCLITEEVIAREILPMKKKLVAKNKAAIAKIELLRTPANTVEVAYEDSPFEGVGFSQVNTGQNEKLIQTVLQWMRPFETTSVLDLYAGAGNFTFPLMNQFPKASLTAVELSEKSVKQAQSLIRTQNVSPHRLKYYLADVELYLKRNPVPENSLVLLDPPRSGCSENTVRYLAEQTKIQRIFYISCNPAALARDLERFQMHGGWKPLRVQPFDMFPQTDHVETLVELGIDSP